MHVERCRQGSDSSELQKTSFHAAFSSNSSDFERYWSTNSLERKHKSVIKQNRNGSNRNARTLWNEASTSRISSKSQLFSIIIWGKSKNLQRKRKSVIQQNNNKWNMNALTLWIEDDEKNFIASNAQTWREWWCRFNLSLQEDIYFKKTSESVPLRLSSYCITP